MAGAVGWKSRGIYILFWRLVAVGSPVELRRGFGTKEASLLPDMACHLPLSAKRIRVAVARRNTVTTCCCTT